MRVFNSISRDGDFGKRIEGYCCAFDRKCDIKDQSESDILRELMESKAVLLIIIFLNIRMRIFFI